MGSELEHYEAMARVSAQMVVAAQDNDWTRLGQLEGDLATLRDALQTRYAGVPTETLDETARQRKRELITRILEHDREIRRHTEPWMASMRKLLAGRGIEQNLRKAYGAGH